MTMKSIPDITNVLPYSLTVLLESKLNTTSKVAFEAAYIPASWIQLTDFFLLHTTPVCLRIYSNDQKKDNTWSFKSRILGIVCVELD